MKNHFEIKLENKFRKAGSDSNKNYTYPNGLIYADKEVKYSWFFKTRTERFGFAEDGDYIEYMNNIYREKGDFESINNNYEESGLCHYIAVGLLIQYMEFFKTNDYFSENQTKKYMELAKIENWYAKRHGYPTAPIFNEWFIWDLWQIYGNGVIDTYWQQLQNAIRKFIKADKKFNQVLMFQLNDDQEYLLEKINAGKPFLIYSLFMPSYQNDPKDSHSVVVYGYYYNNGKGGKYLCHYRWEGASQVILSTESLQWYYAIDIDLRKKTKPSPIKPYFLHNGKYVKGTDYE
ncbi:putative cysteine peptidase [Mycoplasmopsis felifaucium]|uniref:Peptidase C39-like domain-containing protein n=1 Tax=Mycoplasmopsis felifaucium TaxID=35768 RepID=A0ABZ2RY88_9BACT